MKISWIASLIFVLGGATTAGFAQPPQTPPLNPVAQELGGFSSLPPLVERPGPVQPYYVPTVQVEEVRTRFYAYGEYLLWWLHKDNLPPLVTSGSTKDNPPGAINQPGTTLLYGSQQGPSGFSGFRITLGYWLDPDQTWFVESNYFQLVQRVQPFQTAGGAAGTGTLNVPFFNADRNIESAFLITNAGKQTGNINVVLSDRLWGGEVNVGRDLWRTEGFEISLLGGFRYLSLDESLELDTIANVLPIGKGAHRTTIDNFATSNRFYGGQFGLLLQGNLDRWFIDVQGKLAMGDTLQSVNISGQSLNNDPTKGTTVVSPGGLFSGPNNLGDHSNNQFTLVSELGVTVRYQWGRYVTTSLGYTLLHASNVVRPGEEIDRARTTSGTRPTFLGFQSTDFWAQGVNVGLLLQY
jgi:hypothetical protein